MGLFGNKESREEIYSRVSNSECGTMFAVAFCSFFSESGDLLKWLMANSKERMYKIDFYKEGIMLKQVEVSRQRHKETGTYDVDSFSFGFGEVGFEDLPNGKYVDAFRTFLLDKLKNNCPLIKMQDPNYIMLADNAKKGW